MAGGGLFLGGGGVAGFANRIAPCRLRRGGPQAAGLLGLWPFYADAPADTLREWTLTHGDPTLIGAPTWLNDPDWGNALVFAGASNYVDCGSGGPVTQWAGAFTVCAWVYPTSTASTRYYVGNRNAAGTAGWRFGYRNNIGLVNLRLEVAGVTYETSDQSANFSNIWRPVAAAYDGGAAVSFYRDGLLRQTISAASTPAANNDRPLTFGADLASGSPASVYQGYLAEVRVYAGALGADALARLADPNFLGELYEARGRAAA